MSDYDSIQNRRNMIVGAFVIIGILVFVYMIFIFRELPIAVAKLTSYTVVTKFENAPGIEQNTAVKYCGYNVGKVTYVSPPTLAQNKDGDFINQVTVKMAISRDYSTIPSNVVAELISKSLSSGYIELCSKPMTAEEFSALDPKFLIADMEVPGMAGSSGLLPKDIQDKMEVLFEKVTVLLDNTNKIIGDVENQQNLKATLSNLSKATDASVEAMENIKELSKSGRETMLLANEKIGTVSDSVTKSSEQLGEALIEMQRVLYKINHGDGTIGKLLNDGKLYENLLDSSEELKESLNKMKKTFDKTSEKGIKVSVF